MTKPLFDESEVQTLKTELPANPDPKPLFGDSITPQQTQQAAQTAISHAVEVKALFDQSQPLTAPSAAQLAQALPASNTGKAVQGSANVFVNKRDQSSSLAASVYVDTEFSQSNSSLTPVTNSSIQAAAAQRIAELAESLSDIQSIMTYGREITAEISAFSDKIIESAQIDTTALSGPITTVLVAAQGIDLNNPVAKATASIKGKLKHAFKSAKEILKAEFTSLEEKLDELTTLITSNQTTFVEKAGQLQAMFDLNRKQAMELELHIRALELKKAAKQQELETLRLQSTGSLVETQALAGLEFFIKRLDKKMDAMAKTQHLCLQAAPLLQVSTENCFTLSDKFEALLVDVVPEWKKQMFMAIMQENIAVGNTVTKVMTAATNDMIVNNAEAAAKNTVEATRLSEESVVSIDALQRAQNALINALSETAVIEREGAAKRQQSRDQLTIMRQELATAMHKGGVEHA
jgi:uncharacterized protein YaaN involved in tellurite resistance